MSFFYAQSTRTVVSGRMKKTIKLQGTQSTKPAVLKKKKKVISFPEMYTFDRPKKKRFCCDLISVPLTHTHMKKKGGKKEEEKKNIKGK